MQRNFEPILDEGPDGTIIVTDWAAGFLDAIKLRREAWEPLFTDCKARTFLVPLVILGADEDFFAQYPSPQEGEFYAAAPGLLLARVIGVRAFWLDSQPDRRGTTPRRRIRRR